VKQGQFLKFGGMASLLLFYDFNSKKQHGSKISAFLEIWCNEMFLENCLYNYKGISVKPACFKQNICFKKIINLIVTKQLVSKATGS